MWTPIDERQIRIVVEIGQIGERNCDSFGSNGRIGQEFYFLSVLTYAMRRV